MLSLLTETCLPFRKLFVEKVARSAGQPHAVCRRAMAWRSWQIDSVWKCASHGAPNSATRGFNEQLIWWEFPRVICGISSSSNCTYTKMNVAVRHGQAPISSLAYTNWHKMESSVIL